MTEIWKPIKDYPLYEVSDFGRVRKISSMRILKHSLSEGYPSLELRKDSKGTYKRIHRLIAKEFIANPENLPLVLHRDGNRQNNLLSNLYWGTYSDNTKDCLNHGTMKTGESCTHAKLTSDIVRQCRIRYKSGGSTRGMAREYGVDPATMHNAITGRQWRHI